MGEIAHDDLGHEGEEDCDYRGDGNDDRGHVQNEADPIGDAQGGQVRTCAAIADVVHRHHWTAAALAAPTSSSTRSGYCARHLS